MFRKIITKRIIFNSLHFAYPLVLFSHIKLNSSFSSFSTERSAQNHSKSLHNPKDKQSSVNLSSTKGSESSDRKSDNDVSKKR